jgi:hypothetical protein
MRDSTRSLLGNTVAILVGYAIIYVTFAGYYETEVYCPHTTGIYTSFVSSKKYIYYVKQARQRKRSQAGTTSRH